MIQGYDVGLPLLSGRRDILVYQENITPENVLSVVNSCLGIHMLNVTAEDYLWKYRRGICPVLHRTKDTHQNINNKIVASISDEICSFKNGYFLTQPATFVSRNKKSSAKVQKLNEYLYRSGKHNADNEVVNWFHTCGKGVLFVQANNDEDVPVRVYSIDPRSAFVGYSVNPGHEPVIGCNVVIRDSEVLIDAYTKEYVFRLRGTDVVGNTVDGYVHNISAAELVGVERNFLNAVPIIEYKYNSINMGAFESVITLLDAYNSLCSDRVDGVSQFIQSVVVATNCEFEEGTTADTIRNAGMICLRSTTDNKATFEVLSEQLDQQQTQTLIDDIYGRIMSICGMPATSKDGGGSTSDNGVAVLARNGWYNADTCARNTEDLFKKSNEYFERIFIDILDRMNIVHIKRSDFELQIVRNETANIQNKALSYATLVQAGVHPMLAMKKSGISNDPEADFRMSLPYINLLVGDPTKKEEENAPKVGRTEQPDLSGEAKPDRGMAENGQTRPEEVRGSDS